MLDVAIYIKNKLTTHIRSLMISRSDREQPESVFQAVIYLNSMTRRKLLEKKFYF